MKGHVAQKGTKYYIVVDWKDEKGKRKRKWLSGPNGKGFDRKKDAEKAMPDILSKINHGTFVEKTNETFGEMMEKWLQDKKSEVRPGTWKAYAWLVNVHLIPHLGNVKLTKLEPRHLRDLYHETLFKEKNLAASSIKKLHVLVNEALKRAIEWRKIEHNVAAVVKLPRGKPAKFEVWNEEQLQIFLKEAANDKYFIAFELATSTGMRQSEILGLRWQDVDLQNKTISVRQAYTKAETGHDIDDTKSDSGERSIALFDDTVKHLLQHKMNQAKERMRNRKLYNDHGLVIQSKSGTPVNPRNLMRSYYRILERTGLPRIRFHDLRHTHATLLLKKGVHPKIVQERLGHSSVNVTLDIYSHVLPNLQAAVLQSLGNSIVSSSTEPSTQLSTGMASH